MHGGVGCGCLLLKPFWGVEGRSGNGLELEAWENWGTGDHVEVLKMLTHAITGV